MFSPNSRKPKFLLDLSIKELTNIPKPSGSCYIKWSIKDSTTSTIKGRTLRAHIKDYRAHWTYTDEFILKLNINRATKELSPKILVLEVYIIPHQHHHHIIHSSQQPHNKTSLATEKKDINTKEPSESTNSSQAISNPQIIATKTAAAFQNFEDLIPVSPHKSDNERQYLGKVELNLSEFTQFDEKGVNVRSLLMDSKVNAILNLRIGMELIKGNRDDFLVPHFGSYKGSKGRGIISSIKNDISSVSGSGSQLLDGHGLLSPIANGGSISQLSSGLSQPFLNDPVLTKLYERTFEISWDVRPGEFTALETIEDIYQGGDGWAKNEEGVKLIDKHSQRLDQLAKEARSTDKLYHDNASRVKGNNIRPDLRSWGVSSFGLQT